MTSQLLYITAKLGIYVQVTDRQTDHASPSVTTGHIYVLQCSLKSENLFLTTAL